MPAAVGIGALVALAFAFAAIAATLMVRTLIVSPMRASAAGVSGIPVIGGSLAWLIVNAMNMIELGLNTFDWGQEATRQQALSWWNWLVATTAWYLGIPDRVAFGQARIDINAVTALAQFMYYGQIPPILATALRHQSEINAVTAQSQHIWYQDLPDIRGIEAGLRVDVNAVTRLAQDLFYRELPTIKGIDAGLRTDVNAVTRLAQQTWYDALPRMRDDINSRALQSDLLALRDIVMRQQALLGTLAALVPLAIAGAEAINNLRCASRLGCLDWDAINNGDLSSLEGRVSMLEVGSM